MLFEPRGLQETGRAAWYDHVSFITSSSPSVTLFLSGWIHSRLLCRQLSIDELWWERAEGLDVCTVPITGSEEWWRWIPRYRSHGVFELELVVDLVAYPFSLALLVAQATNPSTTYNLLLTVYFMDELPGRCLLSYMYLTALGVLHEHITTNYIMLHERMVLFQVLPTNIRYSCDLLVGGSLDENFGDPHYEDIQLVHTTGNYTTAE